MKFVRELHKTRNERRLEKWSQEMVKESRETKRTREVTK